MASIIERSIDVEVPVEAVYRQWTQFDEFPMFMEGVQDVRQVDGGDLLWRGEVRGRVMQWRAEVVERVPYQRLAWRARSDGPPGGLVKLRRLAPGRTRVVLQVEYEAEAGAARPADAAGTLAARLEGDLRRFKWLAEARGEPAGVRGGRATEAGRG
jgi:uncharacterized membrane protein